jgi:hypothetical protein
LAFRAFGFLKKGLPNLLRSVTLGVWVGCQTGFATHRAACGQKIQRHGQAQRKMRHAVLQTFP